MKTGACIYALFAGLALLAAPPLSVAFQDPLDTPAVMDARAPRSLLNDIVLAGKRLVAVGQRGHIVYSDDHGKHWTQAAVPVSSDLTAVSFPTPMMGWAVGHDGVVLATKDGGVTWARQLDGRAAALLMKHYYTTNPPLEMTEGSEALTQLQADVARFAEEGPDKPFLDVWFENESTGYVVGLFNLIFRTSDGGKSWTPLFDRTENARLLHFYAVHPVDDDLYLTGEQGMVLRLDKKSQRFQAVSIDYKGTFFGITNAGPSILVFGLRGNVFRSEDRGTRWRKVDTGIAVAITAATRTTDGHVVLVSQAGHVLVSPDDGKSFTQANVERVPASALVSVAPQQLVIAGARGVHVKAIKQ